MDLLPWSVLFQLRTSGKIFRIRSSRHRVQLARLLFSFFKLWSPSPCIQRATTDRDKLVQGAEPQPKLYQPSSSRDLTRSDCFSKKGVPSTRARSFLRSIRWPAFSPTSWLRRGEAYYIMPQAYGTNRQPDSASDSDGEDALIIFIFCTPFPFCFGHQTVLQRNAVKWKAEE